jgi:hypothetical protein
MKKNKEQMHTDLFPAEIKDNGILSVTSVPSVAKKSRAKKC